MVDAITTTTNLAQRNIALMAVVMEGTENFFFSQLLKLGKCGVVTKFTPEERKIVAALRKKVKPERQQCFANSQKAGYQGFYEAVHYVEGYIVRRNCPVEVHHGWLTLNGKVVDLTLPSDECDYFGIEIPWPTVTQFLVDYESHGPMLADMELGYKYAATILDPDGQLRAALAGEPT